MTQRSHRWMGRRVGRCAGTLAPWLALVAGSSVSAQAPSVLARRYRDGDSLHYRMDATNQGRDGLVRYAARADGVVHRDSLGRFVETLEWSHLVRNDTSARLPAGTAAVRQVLTLAPDVMIPPDVAKTHPMLIGPVLDLLTFYVDAWIAAKVPLTPGGAHVRVPGHGSNSWADGRRIVLGEDAVDFDIALTAVDSAARVARVRVRHVPATQLLVRLPAEWMRIPLFDLPNNWVEVTHADDGSYIAAVGREVFDVDLVVSLDDGRIVSAMMDNPVDVMERTCRDAALTSCGASSRYRIMRQISLRPAT